MQVRIQSMSGKLVTKAVSYSIGVKGLRGLPHPTPEKNVSKTRLWDSYCMVGG